MKSFLWGASAMASFVAFLFFLRFYRDTRDRLFAGFALAFALLAMNFLGLSIYEQPQEAVHPSYYLRLGGFAVIAWTIIDKNRSG